MKIKSGFVMRDVCGEKIIISEGVENIDFSTLIAFNSSAAFIWESVVGRDFTIDDIVTSLTAEYDVDEATARKDAEMVIQEWSKLGLVQL